MTTDEGPGEAGRSSTPPSPPAPASTPASPAAPASTLALAPAPAPASPPDPASAPSPAPLPATPAPAAWQRVPPGVWLAALLALAAGLVIATYGVLAKTWDEGVHIVAGLEWLRHGTYVLLPENPPLSRVPAALGPYLGGGRLPPDYATMPPLYVTGMGIELFYIVEGNPITPKLAVA